MHTIITKAAHAAPTHTVLEGFAYGGHVGGHFAGKSCTYYSFVTKVMCTEFGVERPTSHFGGHVGGHFWKKSCTYYYFLTKVMCTKFSAEKQTSHFGGNFGRKNCTYFVTKVMCTEFGAERPTSHFSYGRPLEMAATLTAIWEKKLLKSCTSMQRYCVPNLVTKETMV